MKLNEKYKVNKLKGGDTNFNPSTGEAKIGSRLAWLQKEFQDSQGYTESLSGNPHQN